jgi:heat shock protein HspQ
MKNKFQTGQIIQHKRYPYRGVIIEWDPHCKAEDSWYLNNQTQPSRHQPWYHVLVDGAAHTTYVAEENLELDVSSKEITHPLLQKFFTAFYRGRYYRECLN